MGDRAVAGDQAPESARIDRVRLLGGVQAVAADGSVVDLGSASQRRLLALLALHAPNRMRSERLSDTLGVSVGALRKTVSRLRAAIGADVLLTAGTGYSLGCEVDAALFCAAVTGANGRRSAPRPRGGAEPLDRTPAGGVRR